VNELRCACDVRAEGPFAGWDDYDSFSRGVAANACFVPTPVVTSFSNVGFIERWFQCQICQQRWRLVEPDPPFTGRWERVSG